MARNGAGARTGVQMFGQYPSGRGSVIYDRHCRRDVSVEDGFACIIYDGHTPANKYIEFMGRRSCDQKKNQTYASIEVVPPGPTPTLMQEIDKN